MITDRKIANFAGGSRVAVTDLNLGINDERGGILFVPAWFKPKPIHEKKMQFRKPPSRSSHPTQKLGGD